MKTKDFFNWKALLVVASLPFLAAGISRPDSPQTADEDVIADSPATSDAAGSDVIVTNQVVSTNSAEAAPTVPPGVKLYGGTAEIVKLAQAGMSKDVMLTYISNSSLRFALTSDQIIYLNDLGVSSDVVTAMLQHDATQTQAAPVAATDTNAVAMEQPTPTAPPVETIPYTYPPATQPMDYPVTANPPDYVNPYPVVSSVPVASDAGYFYDSLAPYGNWITLADYGPCWQPTVYLGDRHWRPYGDRGRWLYTDNGWYWQSDYSWGWAAFHYGRWTHDTRAGWVWVPNRVWGPSWVSWRTTGDYVGWAPLPPSAVYVAGVGLHFHNRGVSATFDFGLTASSYTFIPTERLSDYYPVIYGVTRVPTASIFNKSVVINNVTDVHHQVVCGGIDPLQIVAAGGTPVRHAILRESQNDQGDRRFRTDRMDVRGNSLVIFRPQLPEPTAHLADATSTTSSRVHVSRVPRDDAKLSAPSAVPLPSVAPDHGSAPDNNSRVHIWQRRTPDTTASVATPAPARPAAPVLLPPGTAPANNVTTANVSSTPTQDPGPAARDGRRHAPDNGQPAVLPVPARATSTILVPRGTAAAAGSPSPVTSATTGPTTVRIPVQRTFSTTIDANPAPAGDPRPDTRPTRFGNDNRRDPSPDTGSTFRPRGADSTAVTPGSSYRTTAPAATQPSGVLLPRSSAAYGLESSTPSTTRSSTSYGLPSSGSGRTAVLLPAQSYAPPAPAAPAARSYSPPASYSAPAPSAPSRSSSPSSSGSSSSSSSGNGRNR